MARILLISGILCLIFLLTIVWNFSPMANVAKEHHIVRRNTHINYTSILNFWKKHKEQLSLHSVDKDVVLVMGNTGAGKSTLVSAIIGKKLRALKKNGYLVIVDEEERIGTGTSSKTTIPEPMNDSKKNITYIDCPGFGDNRNIEHEISSIYFQNILMSQVEKIKLVLVINYDSLKTNGNKNDFDNLMINIGKFIKDISKFHDGITLVATKVPNVYEQSDDDTFFLSNDDQTVLNGIVNYLEEKKNTFQIKTDNNEKYKMFAGLIEVLLEKKNDSYTRISLFRQPVRQGYLENIRKTKNEINTIITAIVENLQYVEINRQDFGFSLSESLKNIVDQIVSDIFSNALNNRLQKMGQETLNHYSQIEKQYSDIGILREQFSRAYDDFSGIKDFDGPLKLFEKFLIVINNLNIFVSLTNLNTISEDIKELKFFTTLSNNNGETHMLLLKNELQNITNSIENLRNFYEFLNNLQKNLAAYNAQQLINDNRITNIMRSCESTNYMTVQDIKDLNNISKEIGSDEIYRIIKTLVLNQFQLKHLQAVFGAFATNFEFSCESSSEPMIVKGYNIKLSNLTNIDCWKQAKNILIFALNTVFIDCNINKTGAEAQIFILAPTWEIIHGSTIILNGDAGEPHQSLYAKSSNLTSINGENGLPGLPGRSGGNFFAVGKRFINLENLEILANGGNGGPGQHGGNGTNGIHGEGLTDSFLNTVEEFQTLLEYLKQHRYTFAYYTDDSERNDRPFYMDETLKYFMVVYGKPAINPSDPGDGGAGGSAGYEGRIVMTSLGNSVNVKNSSNAGHIGIEGKGGYGGIKAAPGPTVSFIYSIFSSSSFIHREKITNISKNIARIVTTRKVGRPGGNTSKKKNSIVTPMTNVIPAIISYKHFVRRNLYENIRESELKALLDAFEENNAIKGQYNTLAFVKELDDLEKQFFELGNKTDFVPFYNSFLSRVEEFANSANELENKIVLSYIYTAALTKTLSLKKKRKGKTVVDLAAYLKTIETSVKEMSEVQHLQTVRNYQNDYKNTLQNKIREANYFIENKIEPAINKLWEESENQIQTIIDEIEKNKNSTNNALTSLQKNRAMIRNTMQLRAILQPIKLAGSALSFFGPIGAGVGAVVTGSAEIANGMLLDTTSIQQQNKVQLLDPKLKISRVSEVLNNKPEKLAAKLTEAVAQLDNYKEELFITQDEKNNITQMIGDLKTQVLEVKNRKITRISQIEQRDKDTKRIEKDLNEFINSRKIVIERETTQMHKSKSQIKTVEELKKEKRIETSLRHINNAQSILNCVEMIFSFMKSKEKDDGLIININKQISEQVDQFKDLEKMEGQVYDLLLPDFKQIEKTVNDIMTSLNGSSHAKLDITKWTVRNTLKEVKSMLQKFTHKMTFELQSNLMRHVEKIDEGFSILIDIYERIDSYSDSVKQAEYIAHIMSPATSNVQVNDSELSSAIIDLKFKIQSNLLLEQYGIALHAFKQHYFPFAAQALQKFQLPIGMQLNDTETLISNIITSITHMKNYIDESKATIDEFSKFIHENNVFNSNTTGSLPFYVWNHDSIKEEIQQLLNGSEILIKADISKGVSYNSVKYSDIGINFKLKNESLQNNFTSLLKNFVLSMTMVGNNYYRCGERYYFISFDDNITISYTLNQDDTKNWINPNLVYSKIRDSHSFLSPYGLWSIKLKSINGYVSFNDLKVYAKEAIDLELNGRGYYIEHDSEFNFNVCNEYLDTFYNVENIAKVLG